MSALAKIFSTLNVVRKSTLLIQNFRLFAFSSSYSLDKLYPGSNLKITTPTKPQGEGDKFSGYIPLDQLQITYSKSTGPGGQNVNKVNTKVDVRFHLSSVNWISNKTKSILADKCSTRITKDGYFVLKSDITRSQQLNLADCLEKLRCTIREAEYEKPEPTPETQERLRRRYEKFVADKLALKRHRGQIKEGRRDPTISDA